jgi:hypothetical protein
MRIRGTGRSPQRCEAAALLLLFAAVIAAAPVHAQSAARPIAGEATCRACRIELVRIATVNDEHYPDGAIGRGAGVLRSRNGTFLVNTGFTQWDALYLAERNGSIVRRIGRPGSGPGEFRIPMFTLETDSAFLVLDPVLGRMSLLHQGSLAYRSSSNIPGTLTSARPVAWPDGTFVFWGTSGEPGAAGLALHVVGPDGRRLRSFRQQEPLDAEVAPVPTVLAVSGANAFWALFQDYRIERWSLDGRLLASFQRQADWLSPGGQQARRAGGRVTTATHLQ